MTSIFCCESLVSLRELDDTISEILLPVIPEPNISPNTDIASEGNSILYICVHFTINISEGISCEDVFSCAKVDSKCSVTNQLVVGSVIRFIVC